MSADTDPPIHAVGPRRPEPGLHLVATPIGAARDITLRALDTLAGADVLAAEDTRTLRHLMEIHGIALGGRPLIAYHDHNGDSARPRLLAALASGKSVAYASEAGTPLVADPGLKLARAAIDAGIKVVAAPGASAVLTALSVAGLPTDRFLFAGFPPAAAGARRTWIAELAPIPATLVVYESPKRVSRTLGELCDLLGAERPAAVCRELTKRFEEVRRGSLGSLSAELAGQALRGEIVVVIGRGEERTTNPADVDAALRVALDGGARVKAAATLVADRFGLSRREVYAAALRLTEQN
jgi:16S rRNA (cytidine1402-2'-O)-methyltransferase